MSNLQCNVTTCGYNNVGCCCHTAIKVQGQDAKNCSQTRCQSFVQNNRAFSNSSSSLTPQHSLDIYCTAEQCKFNSNKKCGADRICINGDTADYMSETECSSFTKR